MKLKDCQTIFTAMSDRTRFRILSLLSEGELCVCDVMRVLKEPQSKISRHLAYLRRAQLVEARKEGLWMYYRLARPSTKVFQAIFEALNCCRSEFGELKKDIGEFRKNKSRLIACCK
jgi:ArsR family transcriptional regulator